LSQIELVSSISILVVEVFAAIDALAIDARVIDALVIGA
jgi:fructose-specific phosphotransferase system IIC component